MQEASAVLCFPYAETRDLSEGVQLIREFAANTPSPALKDAVFVPPGWGRLPRARKEPVEQWGREHRISELPVKATSFICPCGSAAECDPGTKRSLVRFPVRASARAVSLTPQHGACRKQRMDDVPLFHRCFHFSMPLPVSL